MEQTPYPAVPPYEPGPSYPTAPLPPAYPTTPPYGDVWQSPGAPPLPPPPAPPQDQYWQTPPRPPRPNRVKSALLAAALLVLSTLVGFVIGSGVLTKTSNSPTATATTQRPSTTTPSTGSTNGGTNGSSNGGTNGSTNGSTPSGTDEIVAAIDPAVVDINTTLDGGQAAGTGMLISSDGLVLTNNHVIDGATTVKVQIGGSGPTHNAHVVGYSITDDIALVQIEDVSGLPTVKLGDSDSVKVGDDVVAIGNALGRSGPHAVTTGSVDQLNQTITADDAGGGNGETLRGLIEFNARIQPGDSGGPLVSDKGEVIGINTAATLGGKQLSSTSGFAIPINHAMDIINDIKAGQSNDSIHVGSRAILGVQVQDTTGSVTVEGVESGSPADDAGIAVGDTITKIDGQDISALTDVQQALNPHHPGDKVDVEWVDASGNSQSASIELAEGPPA
jgi:S1-C subfamily serine protease